MVTENTKTTEVNTASKRMSADLSQGQQPPTKKRKVYTVNIVMQATSFDGLELITKYIDARCEQLQTFAKLINDCARLLVTEIELRLLKKNLDEDIVKQTFFANYQEIKQNCAMHGWYLAADFQLFVCSQFVIYAFWRMPRKIGYPFLGVLTLISCTVSFFATYIYNIPAVLQFTLHVTALDKVAEFKTYYIKTHMNATGYLVGIIAGAILHDHKGSTWRLSKFWSHILVFPMPVVLYVAIQYYSHKFFIFREPNLLKEAIFAFFQKLIPALCVCSIIVLLSIGSQSKFYYRFLTPRWARPLVNLTYGVYIVHLIIFEVKIRQARTATTYSNFNIVSMKKLIYAILLITFKNITKYIMHNE
ncbi:uncharacterized protein LOC109503821 [Harpegnathos saltator]|uniref:uncharacterized protein LOC109503821 n=1 Tax=Harpegnathos saltator TaxID=610380 RepID=UPI000DBEEB8B|nr:uncharacterized protein LOC109503821 [Harpegnathos saltator]